MMPECHLPVYDKDNCIFFALGRNAMYAACQLMGLKKGDEVLTPAYDCDGTLQSFKVFGLRIRFFRSDPHTFAADLEDMKRKINENTKLLHIINHFGMPQPWNEVLSIRTETGIPILEDNAYSLFSKFDGRQFGTLGDMSIFSLRKELPLICGGLLRINNPRYQIGDAFTRKAPFCHPVEYLEFVRVAGRRFGFTPFLKLLAKHFYSPLAYPVPLYSEPEKGYPDWPARDKIGMEFSCDYLRPMSGFAMTQLAKFSHADFANIMELKKSYYASLSSRLRDLSGIKVLWPVLPEGVVPFCLSVLVDSKRDALLKMLEDRYKVMAWPTLSRLVLDDIKDYPDVELLGRKLLQINLPSDKVVLPHFQRYLEALIKDLGRLVGSKWNIAG